MRVCPHHRIRCGFCIKHAKYAGSCTDTCPFKFKDAVSKTMKELLRNLNKKLVQLKTHQVMGVIKQRDKLNEGILAKCTSKYATYCAAASLGKAANAKQ